VLTSQHGSPALSRYRTEPGAGFSGSPSAASRCSAHIADER
jgi:hypothetical protein